MATAWTQVVGLGWRPTLRFYEKKIEVLRALEDNELMRQFVVDEDYVAARIGDNDHEIVMRVGGATIQALTPKPDIRRLRKAAEIALTLLEPLIVTSATVSFQHLSRLHGDYEKVRHRTAEAMYGAWTQSIHVDDHAALIDGRAPSGKGTFQTEFGIVSAAEIAARLDRTAGRTLSQSDVDPRGSRWNKFEFPEVALFIDSSWEDIPPAEEGEAPHEAVGRIWDQALDDAEKVIMELEKACGLVEDT